MSQDYGKIRFIAKGVRKQKSKMAGGLELFSVSEIHFIKGRGDIDTLTSARLVTHYKNIVTDLDRTNLAYAMLKKINELVEDKTGQEYLQIVDQSLAVLDNLKVGTDVVKISFQMRVMHAFGIVTGKQIGRAHV